MTSPAPAPQSVWHSLSLGRLTWVALAVVLTVTAIFGGLDAVDRVTAVAMGESYDDGPLLITPHSAAITPNVAGMYALDPACTFLTLDVTMQNKADHSVTLPNALPVIGTPSDCSGPRPQKLVGAFGIEGIPAYFKGAIRLEDGQTMPVVEPGFTTDYRLVWAVPTAELDRHPRISVRIPAISEFISTVRIAESWGGDQKVYGSLDLAPEIYR